jgi:hypothetical protein
MAKWDFSGYATKNDLKCGDGRTIRKDAFKECDGLTVPLVYQHIHDNPDNILGHADLENREDGVYCYGYLNNTPQGRNMREMIRNGDVTKLSIFANKLTQKGGDVLHGVIREVSLVLAGANPGAFIDNVSIAHSDGTYTDLEDEAVIYFDSDVCLEHDDTDDDDDDEEDTSESEESKENESEKSDETKEDSEEDAETDSDSDEEIEHSDDAKKKTVQDVIDSMTDEQKNVMYFLIGSALEGEQGEAKHDDLGDEEMKKNIFDKSTEETNDTLSHSEIQDIINEAVTGKASLKETFLAHGITNIDYLLPETKLINKEPQIINDDQEWVSDVLNSVHKSPFSRIKTIAADITIDEARALGYVKGTKKAEEQFGLLKREVTPQTIYKLQKFDRDDILDITDLDVVAWVKSEMRIKLKEEIARAILVSDGRANSDPHKIKEDKVIPIYKDVSPLTGHDAQIGGHDVSTATFAFRRIIEVPKDTPAADKMEMLIDEAVRARVYYKGSGSPAMYIGPARLAEGLLLKDSMGRRIYESESSLTTAMRVSRAVEVPIFDNITRVENEGEADEQTYELACIIVNLRDYTIGMDKGGQTTLFDDFDIDYNKYTYLLETRLSGMLTKPFSAIIIEFTEVEKEQEAG